MVGTQNTCEGWMTKWLSAPALGQDFKHDILKESSSWNCHVCKSLEFEQIFLKKSAIISWEPFIWFCEEVWIKFPMVENFLSSWGTFLIKHFWSKHTMKSNLFLHLCMRVCTRVSTWSRRRLLVFFLDLLSPTLFLPCHFVRIVTGKHLSGLLNWWSTIPHNFLKASWTVEFCHCFERYCSACTIHSRTRSEKWRRSAQQTPPTDSRQKHVDIWKRFWTASCQFRFHY